jgi:hypothetical protein
LNLEVSLVDIPSSISDLISFLKYVKMARTRLGPFRMKVFANSDFLSDEGGDDFEFNIILGHVYGELLEKVVDDDSDHIIKLSI